MLYKAQTKVPGLVDITSTDPLDHLNGPVGVSRRNGSLRIQRLMDGNSCSTVINNFSEKSTSGQ